MGTDTKRVAVIGTGVIGASWTALFLATGLEVTATDVAPGAEGRLRRFVADTAVCWGPGLLKPRTADRV